MLVVLRGLSDPSVVLVLVECQPRRELFKNIQSLLFSLENVSEYMYFLLNSRGFVPRTLRLAEVVTSPAGFLAMHL